MAKPRREVVDSSNVRQWHVKLALESMTSLMGVVNELTHDEAIYCLNLESRTQRRRSIVNVLIARAVKMLKLSYMQQLKEIYHGSEESNKRG
jgi:hypothetical protein